MQAIANSKKGFQQDKKGLLGNIFISVAAVADYYVLNRSEQKIKKDALDPYTFIRDAYDQNRAKRVKE